MATEACRLGVEKSIFAVSICRLSQYEIFDGECPVFPQSGDHQVAGLPTCGKHLEAMQAIESLKWSLLELSMLYAIEGNGGAYMPEQALGVDNVVLPQGILLFLKSENGDNHVESGQQ